LFLFEKSNGVIPGLTGNPVKINKPLLLPAFAGNDNNGSI